VEQVTARTAAETKTAEPSTAPVETPAAPDREKTGVEREAERLTPVPFMPG
jgi:hypothetical protein